MDLAQLQKKFVDWLPGGQGVEEVIQPGGTLPDAKAALQVYQVGYVARLTEAMGETYSSVWRVLGDDLFFRACKDYITTHPSTFFDLSDYGADFPFFLKQDAECQEFSFIQELAQFDWMFKNIFHKAQHQSVSSEDLASIQGRDDFKFQFGESVTFFAFEYAIHDIWKLCQEDREDQQLLDWYHPQWMMVYKSDQQVYVKGLSLKVWSLLNELGQEYSFLTALDRLSQSEIVLEAADVQTCFEVIGATGIVEKVG